MVKISDYNYLWQTQFLPACTNVSFGDNQIHIAFFVDEGRQEILITGNGRVGHLRTVLIIGEVFLHLPIPFDFPHLRINDGVFELLDDPWRMVCQWVTDLH